MAKHYLPPARSRPLHIARTEHEKCRNSNWTSMRQPKSLCRFWTRLPVTIKLRAVRQFLLYCEAATNGTDPETGWESPAEPDDDGRTIEYVVEFCG